MSRRRYVYRPDPATGEIKAYDITEVTEAGPEARLTIIGDEYYQGLQATDGTPVDSRTKHREYMKNNNLTVSDDFKGVWSQFERDRQNDAHIGPDGIARGTKFGMAGADKRERREAILETIRELKQNGRRDKRR